MLLIGFNPTAVSRACNHKGDGWMRTFSNTSALYRGHNARSSTSIFTGPPAAGKLSSETGSRRFFPVIAATSRAIP